MLYRETPIFRAYDIRGVYPDELNEDMAYRIGLAFAAYLRQATGKQALRLALCHDMRSSSLPLKAAVENGLLDSGVEVIDIGLASTPTFYFGVAYLGYDGGIQITASHNAVEFNGCKLVREQAISIGQGNGMETIAQLVTGQSLSPAGKKGTAVSNKEVLAAEVAFALTQVQVAKIKPFRIVIDTGNGMGAPLMEALFARLPCTVDKLFFELDGTFPNHEANPMNDDNNRVLQERVVEIGADIGIALDGDADRVFFVDHTGKTIPPAIMRGILAQLFLRDNPGAPVCYDIRPGKITEDMILEAGGVPVLTRIGSTLIKAKAREVGAAFAAESSGHFFVRMPFGFFEAPDICILKLLEELSVTGKTLREYTAPLYRYAHSGEINFSIPDTDAVFGRLRGAHGQYLSSEIDGLTFTAPDWWYNIRASQTEQLVRLNVESVDANLTAQKVKEISALIY